MVMSILWTGMTAASILFGIAEGRGEAVAAAAAMEMPMVHRVDPEFFTDVESGMNIALDVEQGTITIL